MREPTNKKQDFDVYLLGLLPDAEAEQFDELSFTDAQFADALSAAEKDLVDGFVRGELSGATLERFENYYPASPLRRKKVEFARSLQILSERNFTAIKSVAAKETSGGFFASVIGFINSKPLQIGFAAGLFLLFAGGLWLVNNRSNQPQTEVVIQNSSASPQNQVRNAGETEIAAVINENTASPNVVNKTKNKNVPAETNRTPQTAKTPVMTSSKIVVATFFLAPSLRGANQLKTLPISKNTINVAVGLQLESDDYSSYRVALTDESGGKNLWQSNFLKTSGTSENKILNIRFPAKLFKSQIHLLTVSGVRDGTMEIISNYSFRIVIR